MIKAYFLPNNSSSGSKYFKLSEFRCRDNSNVVFLDTDLVAMLHKIREHFNAPVTINSGYRTYAHNKTVRGSTKSQHLLGKAADITVKGHTPTEVAKYAQTIADGVGLYKTFVHVDCRGTKAYWKG